MFRFSTLCVGGCVVLTAPALSQATDTLERTTAVRDAGTYHVSTGTWSRHGSGAAQFGPDTIYANVRTTGFFNGGNTATQTRLDHGRLPSPTSPPPNTGVDCIYRVDGFQIGYCTRQTAANFDLTISYYNDYAECSPASLSASGVVASFPFSGVLPASSTSGVLACWLVTINLENTTTEFNLLADVDGVFGTGGVEDKFGWGFNLGNVAGGSSGPIITGSCSGAPAPGEGTYYNNPGTAVNSTGLGTNDFFWIEDTSGASTGCFFFGGCNGNDSNPYASFWHRLYAQTSNSTPLPGTAYCPASLNSTGGPGTLDATGTNFVGDPCLTFTATSIPNTPGFLFFGPNQLAMTPDFGEGVRCVGGATTRVFPVGVAVGNTRSVTLVTDAGYYAAIMSGQQSNFQYWHRETMGAGDVDGDGMVEPFSTTNAYSIDFE